MAPELNGEFVAKDVITVLPPGSEPTEAKVGAPSSVQVARVTVREGDSSKDYIVKRALNPDGETALAEEFASIAELSRPFMVMDFVTTVKRDFPPAPDLCSHLAAIHRSSMSPDNKEFRFLTHNHYAETLGFNQGYPLWETFFANLLLMLRESVKVDSLTWLRSHRGLETLITETVSRLLRPLQSGNRNIQPCLVHGNLSAKNIATHSDTGEPVSFNPTSLYAHNEYELGIWRLPIGGLGDDYFREYRQRFRPAEPIEEWDDRIRLYSIKFGLAYLLSNPSAESVQEQILADIDLLNKKYPLGTV